MAKSKKQLSANETLEQIVNNFGITLYERGSNLCVDKIVQSLPSAMARVSASILSTFEERCIDTGRLLATWIFNRDTCKFILNQQFNHRK